MAAFHGVTSPRSTKPGNGADRAGEEGRPGARRAEDEHEPFLRPEPAARVERAAARERRS